ncbi:MAG: ATP phosphoribosyltransferase regulatory subunit, partial [Candidatus Competibacteraceae bacterium]|nr:ATP phosphoribosyltransferase regulatory subunit [Candidatus Competibacteraceae bacterium]
ELVIPPFIEFLDSLLTGTGNDLDLQTFKLTDQLSGRLMGVRADMTPQVARIDAHQLRREGPVRLCYMGTVLHTRPDGLGGSRAPLQIGAELYGHAGYQSDLEVLLLMLETLAVARVEAVHLDLGHVAIFRHLMGQAALEPQWEAAVFEALLSKSPLQLETCLAGRVEESLGKKLQALCHLHGGTEVLGKAEGLLQDSGAEVEAALETLQQLAAAIQRRRPDLPIHFDLGELRGYRYHTGVVFAAYVPGYGRAVAKGGRYDEIGRVFGRSRPATGFSADLKTLLDLGRVEAPVFGTIYAPQADDGALEALIHELRQRGEQVIQALPGADAGPGALGCDRQLVLRQGEWQVVAVTE